MRKCGAAAPWCCARPTPIGFRRAARWPWIGAGFPRPSKPRSPPSRWSRFAARKSRRCRPSPGGSVILATGPLTSADLAAAIARRTGEESLAFFDAIAPIIHAESIDDTKTWRQSRYGKGDGADYINCALDREQYRTFVAALVAADTVSFHEWEKNTPYFAGCLPIEVMAARGPETLRYGPMKPMGLTDPRGLRRAHAVVQLRQDNALGTLYNLVGFQTKLRHADQVRLFRTIPGLERAEFARLGGLHRNTFINSPKLLDAQLRLKREPRLRFAGQITGVEGYVESAAIGLLAGRFAAAERRGEPIAPPPVDHRARRLARAYHRRRRCRELSADEREFRFVSALARGRDHALQQGREEAADGAPRPGGSGAVAGAGTRSGRVGCQFNTARATPPRRDARIAAHRAASGAEQTHQSLAARADRGAARPALPEATQAMPRAAHRAIARAPRRDGAAPERQFAATVMARAGEDFSADTLRARSTAFTAHRSSGR